MNDEDYTLFVKEIAQYVINVIEPLNPAEKKKVYSKRTELLRGAHLSRRHQFYSILMQEIEDEIIPKQS